MTTKREDPPPTHPPTPMNLNHVYNLRRHQPTTTITSTSYSTTLTGSTADGHQKMAPSKKNNDEGPNTYLHVYHNRSTVNYTVQLLPQEWSLLQTCKLISDISYSFQPSTPQAPLYWRDEHGRHSHSRSPSLLRYLTARRRAVGGVAGERWRERAQFPHPSLFLTVSWNLDQRSSGANTAIQWVAMLTSPVCLS